MKFKISKLEFGKISSFFGEKASDTCEIELEPTDLTATQAIFHNEIKTRAFHEGYHSGFKEGFYQGKKPELKYCMCGCGGNNCALRFCDEYCHLYKDRIK